METKFSAAATDLETVYAYAAADDDTFPADDSHESFLCERSVAYAETVAVAL